MKFMKIFISAMSVLLLVLLTVGALLSGEWTAMHAVDIDAPPEEIWPHVADLARWGEWAPIGEVEAELSNPSTGPGATRAWDDAAWGQGVVTILSASAPRELTYDVSVEEGSLQTTGTLALDARSDGTTLVTWTEAGNFGWNPLLAWFALGMEERQGAQLAVGLIKLKEVVEGPR